MLGLRFCGLRINRAGQYCSAVDNCYDNARHVNIFRQALGRRILHVRIIIGASVLSLAGIGRLLNHDGRRPPLVPVVE